MRSTPRSPGPRAVNHSPLDVSDTPRYLEEIMLRTTTAIATILIAVAVYSGCSRLSKRPKNEWLLDLDRADTIVLRSDRSVVCSITDSDSIRRMRSIYADSKWVPYRATLPNGLDKKVIDICAGDSMLRRFSLFADELWECTSYTENRTTKLNAEDRQRLESMFSNDRNAEQSK
jgi:hypothetical protein